MGTVYFEFRVIGNSMRVAAVDADTGIEVHVIAPTATPRADMERLALRKLERRLDRERAGG
ncbi:MAG: serine hydroxymethyltransferase [Rhodobiaceae bacterium]|nr:serine hydroxymethyltransferase [Rhodobiaceae bacterium]MCC0056434.1 serine hydroxymethyltransferase [Rhodobiaceae bacterium]